MSLPPIPSCRHIYTLCFPCREGQVSALSLSDLLPVFDAAGTAQADGQTYQPWRMNNSFPCVRVSILSLGGFLPSFINRGLEVKGRRQKLASPCQGLYSSAEGCKRVPVWGNSTEQWGGFCCHPSGNTFVHRFLPRLENYCCNR